MLEDLRVLNGELSPKFDKNNNKYTVKVSNDVKKIDFIFKEDEYLNITVYGNDNLKVGENYIIIAVSKGEETNYIYITAIKEEIKEVISLDSYSNTLETPNSMPIYGGSLIAISCFLLIVTLFAFFFGKKKSS